VRKTFNDARADRIGHLGYDDGDAITGLLRRVQQRRISNHENIDVGTRQLSRENRKKCRSAFSKAPLDNEILPFDVSKLPHTLQEAAPLTRLYRVRPRRDGEKPDAPKLDRLLRPRRQRPGRRAAESGDEVAPSKKNAHLALPVREPSGSSRRARVNRSATGGGPTSAQPEPISIVMT
jgi:hypothetical protein